MQQNQENKKIKINNYIIYNEDYKILTFTYAKPAGEEYFCPFPYMVPFLGIDVASLFYLDNVVTNETIFQAVNNKLVKQQLNKIRNYYACYKEFTRDDYYQIMQLCYKSNFEPHFLSIDELINLVMMSKEAETDPIFIDKYLDKPLEELDKRLKYIKY